MVTNVPMAPFTPNSTSRLGSVLHFRYLILIPALFPIANTVCFKNPKLNHNDYNNRVFCNTFDNNHCICSDYLLYRVTASGHTVP